MTQKATAYGKRKPTMTYVACGDCKKVYLLDDSKQCPNCSKKYNPFRGYPGDGGKWY